MKKVKFFSENDHLSLQNAVNHWLSEHNDIAVIASDLEIAKDNSTACLFYIMYAEIEEEEKGKLQTLAVVDQSAASVETNKVVEVITNPEVTLKN